MITRIIFTASLVLITLGLGICQPTTGSLSVKKYPSSGFNARYLRLQKTGEDTAKVNLLLEIASICHRKQTLTAPDSAIMFARQAAALSKQLRYTDGYCEAIFVVCKSYLRKDDLPAAERTLNEANGALYVRLLLALSEYCMDKGSPGSEKMQKASRYLTLANRMSVNLKSRHWMTESTIVMAKYHFRLGQMTLGRNRFYDVISYHKQIHDKAGEAHWWQELGRYIPDTDSTYAIEINSLQHARSLYTQLGNSKGQAECLDNEAYLHVAHGRLDLAEKAGIEELNVLKSAGLDQKLPSCYQRLSKTMLKKKDHDKALEYALLGMESVKALKDSTQLMKTYELIGDLQRTIGNPAESVRYYKLALATITQSPNLAHSLLRRMTQVQIGMNRPGEALASVQWLVKWRGAPQTNADKQLFALMMADSYAGMGKMATAERYYAEVARLNDLIQLTPNFHWYTFTNVAGAEAYLAVARFYARQKQYDKSNRYLAAALRSGNLTPDMERESRYMRYVNDSIAGILPPSTINFQRYVSINDSIDRVTKDEQLELLKANFKSAQREKDIQLLRNEALLRERQLQLSAQKEKLTYAGILTLVCLLMLTYNSFRTKKNKNRQLEAQQDIINKKNVALLKLIDEKELLMKEVHHRVKNNLQTVTSLLTSQSFHLRDQGAVKAIDDSRNRIEAISMLHQRIYQSGNMVGVALKSYVAEMICNLEECFDTIDRIRFSIEVEDIILDLSQTVPVGLILNEAITNSLKYAFPSGQRGHISVSLVRVGHKKLSLRVSDNGIGLPADFDIANSPTFGFQLIKGLTADLNGQLMIRSESGTNLQIDFDQASLPHAGAPLTEHPGAGQH